MGEKKETVGGSREQLVEEEGNADKHGLLFYHYSVDLEYLSKTIRTEKREKRELQFSRVHWE